MEKKLYPVATRVEESIYAKLNNLLLRTAPLCTQMSPLVRVLLILAISGIETGILRLEPAFVQDLQSQISLRPLHPVRVKLEETDEKESGAA